MNDSRGDAPLAPSAGGGKAYWRSLDELADTPKFREFVQREFPAHADEMLAPASRRSFLKFMSASMALAGMTACRWPSDEILPFAQRPEGYVPGEPAHYATAMELGGSATGLLVTSYDGRPVKVEGNPQHPQSLGSAPALAQASILELYDPDRSGTPQQNVGGQPEDRSWSDFEQAAKQLFAELSSSGGKGLRVLSESSSSPSVAAMRSKLERQFPQARWVEYEPTSRDNEREGSRGAFGRACRAHLALDRAERIVSLDDDFLHQHPDAVRNARDFVAGRDPQAEHFNRLTVIESAYSLTGGMADRRIPLPAGQLPLVACCLAAELFLEQGLELPSAAQPLRATLERFRNHSQHKTLASELAHDLIEHRGSSLVAVGPRQPVEIHALAQLMNFALGNVGRTVRFTEEADQARPHHYQAIAELAREIGSGEVQTLLILGGNPAYDAPADLDFATKLAAVPNTIQLAVHRNETSDRCGWHLPRAHFLEAWGDSRGYDGTLSVVQPLIEPLKNGRSVIELLALLLGERTRSGYEIVRESSASWFSGDFERGWRTTLHEGLLADTAWEPITPQLAGRVEPGDLASHLDAGGAAGQLELLFMQDGSVYDGRFANNGWLQELPDPLTSLTWDNAALIGLPTARTLGVDHGDRIRVSRNGTSVELPVYLMPGQAEGSISVYLGYGRRVSGRVGTGVGFDVYPLRGGDAMGWADVTVEKIPGRYKLATTQDHYAIDQLGIEERARRAPTLVREVELADFRADPVAAMHHGHEYHPAQLWSDHAYEGHRWGMSIDLNSCIGCNACVVACQAENNIPVVGKDEVARGREMHWIRVDRYFAGEPEHAEVMHQPVTCHHCENAPCEQVCPVAATVHDHEGLNVMIYNRCVGTRYCANNCPYKVRRFNYFNNHRDDPALATMAYNPEVTLRSRGVMEKCSFCVQRINRVKIRAKNAGREVSDGEITTACEQACPTRAITFGDLSDEGSRVRLAQEGERAYTMLEELNIRPRTRYLARVRNRGNGSGHGAA